jgi:hypothetical protein
MPRGFGIRQLRHPRPWSAMSAKRRSATFNRSRRMSGAAELCRVTIIQPMSAIRTRSSGVAGLLSASFCQFNPRRRRSRVSQLRQCFAQCAKLYRANNHIRVPSFILSGAPMISRSYAKAAGGAGTSWLPDGYRNTACEAINPPPIEHADLFASPGSIPFCPQLWVAQAGLAQLRPRPSKTTRTIASRHRLDSRARQVDTSETAVLSETAPLVGRRSDLSTFPVSYLGVRGSSPLRDTIISIT